MKKCPFCTGEIPDEAAVCQHCKRDLTASPSPRRKRRAGRTALIGLGLLVLAFILEIISGRPTSQLGAILSGLLIVGAMLAAIILFIVAIVQAVGNRKTK
jgi:predicted nucleic acid-binding Zn ribbon protein